MIFWQENEVKDGMITIHEAQLRGTVVFICHYEEKTFLKFFVNLGDLTTKIGEIVV